MFCNFLLFTEFTYFVGNEINHVYITLRQVMTPFRRLTGSKWSAIKSGAPYTCFNKIFSWWQPWQVAQINRLLSILMVLIILMMGKETACVALYIWTPWRDSQPKEFLLHSVAMEASKTRIERIDYVRSYIHRRQPSGTMNTVMHMYL